MKKASVLINLASSFIINFSKKKKQTFAYWKIFGMWCDWKLRFAFNNR